jgi:hypothetical protein
MTAASKGMAAALTWMTASSAGMASSFAGMPSPVVERDAAVGCVATVIRGMNRSLARRERPRRATPAVIEGIDASVMRIHASIRVMDWGYPFVERPMHVRDAPIDVRDALIDVRDAPIDVRDATTHVTGVLIHVTDPTLCVVGAPMRTTATPIPIGGAPIPTAEAPSPIVDASIRVVGAPVRLRDASRRPRCPLVRFIGAAPPIRDCAIPSTVMGTSRVHGAARRRSTARMGPGPDDITALRNALVNGFPPKIDMPPHFVGQVLVARSA